MKKHMIKKISILMTALLLLICLPMTAQAEKGSTHGRATPSNMEREEVTEEPEDEAGDETEDVMVSETGEPEEELTVLEEETEAMKEAGVDYVYQSVYEITYSCLVRLLNAA